MKIHLKMSSGQWGAILSRPQCGKIPQAVWFNVLYSHLCPLSMINSSVNFKVNDDWLSRSSDTFKFRSFLCLGCNTQYSCVIPILSLVWNVLLLLLTTSFCMATDTNADKFPKSAKCQYFFSIAMLIQKTKNRPLRHLTNTDYPSVYK